VLIPALAGRRNEDESIRRTEAESSGSAVTPRPRGRLGPASVLLACHKEGRRPHASGVDFSIICAWERFVKGLRWPSSARHPGGGRWRSILCKRPFAASRQSESGRGSGGRCRARTLRRRASLRPYGCKAEGRPSGWKSVMSGALALRTTPHTKTSSCAFFGMSSLGKRTALAFQAEGCGLWSRFALQHAAGSAPTPSSLFLSVRPARGRARPLPYGEDRAGRRSTPAPPACATARPRESLDRRMCSACLGEARA